jgi:predicted nucleic acid-binding protein
MICIDASLAVKWLLREDWTDEARALLRASVNADREIVAPPLLPMEVTNTLRQRMRTMNGLSIDEALLLLEEFLDLPVVLRNPEGLNRRALILADVFRLPAVYDAHYLALAEQLDCELWTADRRLVRAVAPAMPLVRFIGDYDRGPVAKAAKAGKASADRDGGKRHRHGGKHRRGHR